MMKNLLVLDRDGTIIKDDDGFFGKDDDWIKKIEFNIKLIEYIKNNFDLKNTKIIMLTNQGGVAKGIFTEERVIEINTYITYVLGTYGIHIDDVQYCPYGDIDYAKDHSEDYNWNLKYLLDGSGRKPSLDMLIDSLRKLNIYYSIKEDGSIYIDTDYNVTFIGNSDEDRKLANKVHITHTEYFDVNEDIPCILCEALKNEKDKFLYEDDDVIYLPVKYMQKHKKKIMVVSKKHTPQFDGLKSSTENYYIHNFVEFCKDYFDDEPTFVLCEPTYASITNHWHICAMDWFNTKNWKKLHYTPHKAIATKVKMSKEDLEDVPVVKPKKVVNIKVGEGLSKENKLGDKPLMTEKEIDLIKKYLKPTDVMFEWGSGGSTLYFSKLVNIYVSIEHQKHWYDIIAKFIKQQRLYNIIIKFIPQDKEFDYKDKNYKREWFKTYISSIRWLGPRIYDVVLIDGENRTRAFCAEESLHCIHKDSVVFIHDYSKRKSLQENKVIKKNYDIIDKIDSLVVLKKKEVKK